MTDEQRYTPATYRNRVKMSDEYKFLLVEGSSDKRFFKMLRDELGTLDKSWEKLRIHSAEELEKKESVGDGNREIVEQLCKDIAQFPNSQNFAGFVDREFRGFEIHDTLKDSINGHLVSGRLVWSRGHSIENYYFDVALLKKPLRTFSVSEYYDTALDLFEHYLYSAIQLACAASLAGRENENQLNLIKSSIDWSVIRLSNNTVNIDIERWRSKLIRRRGITDEVVDLLAESLLRWLPVVKNANFDIVRWLCHGHVGMRFIWATYGCCIHEVCTKFRVEHPERHVQRVLMAEESVRFNACADEWVSRVLGEKCFYPAELFGLLSLTIPAKN
jgi:hypothetical protein